MKHLPPGVKMISAKEFMFLLRRRQFLSTSSLLQLQVRHLQINAFHRQSRSSPRNLRVFVGRCDGCAPDPSSSWRACNPPRRGSLSARRPSASQLLTCKGSAPATHLPERPLSQSCLGLPELMPLTHLRRGQNVSSKQGSINKHRHNTGVVFNKNTM